MKIFSFFAKHKLHNSRAAVYWLAFLAFLESSVFFFPADVLYIPLLLTRRDMVYKYAFIATIFSVAGGLAGWFIGAFAYKSIALPLLQFYGKEVFLENLCNKTNLKLISLFLLSSGLVHLPPLKLVNILAGMLHVKLPIFLALTLTARACRLYGLAWLVKRYGDDFMYKLRKIILRLKNMHHWDKIAITALVILLLFTACTSFALEYLYGFLPCKLCLWERYLYIVSSACALLSLFYLFVRGRAIALCKLAYLNFIFLICNLVLSFYHHGVEHNWWPGPTSCSSTNANIPDNTNQLIEALSQKTVVACDIVQAYIMHLSLTSWSIIICVIALLLNYLFLRNL